MSVEFEDLPEPERPDGSEPALGPNTPATASLQLVVAAWLVSIVSGLIGWPPGSYVSGVFLLAAFPIGVWGLRRARRVGGAGKGRARAALIVAMLTLLLPIPLILYVRHLRETALLKIEKNLLKQVGLGMHNYAGANRGFLVPSVYDWEKKAFNPGLSWRVEMLPYVEAYRLYQQFRLDESWDGRANRPLADERVRMFVSPYDPPDATQTRYHIFVGGGAMFEYGKRTSFEEVTDGTSNTIMAAEGREASPFSKPFDLPYAPDRPIPALGREDASGFTVLMADGSVRYVRKSVSEATLRAAITAAGQDVLGPDW